MPKIKSGAIDASYIIKIYSNKVTFRHGHLPLLACLDVELTERCNNDCIHCYINVHASDAAAKQKELGIADIKTILREAVSLGCAIVRFTGGEPLLRHDFEELYIYARTLGLKVLLFTNASLITPHLAELFSRIPPLERIEISVYGMTEASCEAATRTKGSYAATRQGIRLLLEYNVPFVVKGVLLPSNRHEADAFETWAANIPWMDSALRYALFINLRWRRDADKKNELIKKLRFSPEEIMKMLTRKPTEYVNRMKKYCARFIGPRGDRLFSCGSGVGKVCLDAYGMLQPCMMLRHPDCVYDLKNGSLKDALTNFFPKIREKKAANPDYLSRCARCFLKGLCEQCPAKSWTEHGTLDKPVEYLCQIAHTQAMFLGLLGQGEQAWEVKDWRERIAEFSGKEPAAIMRQGESVWKRS